ncbi:hypothetical protein PV328_009965 [Microctonus aethiopoides]|uniref:SHSP domain-containing protein n=1 Tax=Microctonus aethiopoides TaxID=144406 RepID=A0AA39C741_9HYME|nr:hypothetical protein PV328_009965 [Microctonus aethiopoides]
MSLVPLLFSNWWEDLNRPHRLVDQDFGLGFYPDQLLIPFEQRVRHPLNYYRPWGQQYRENNVGTSTITSDKDKFQVILDVQQFKPEEINVKVVDNNVVVEGKHEEKKDEHGYISRHFVRKYLIPDQCDLSQVSSSLSSDGVLSITAPRKDVPMVENEKKIEIKYVDKPAIAQISKKSKDQGDKNVDQKMQG